VQQVLLFAKGGDASHSAIMAAPLIAELDGLIQATFPKSIRFKTAVPAGLWPLNADQTQMHQVLLNLCLNARDAMPNGGTISLSAENIHVDAAYASAIWELKPGPYVLLKIRDSGTGIAPEIVDKIFEPFFTTKGSGLGLSTVFGIIKKHAGAVAVKSVPGEGTTISVYLPAIVAAPSAPVEEGPVAAIRSEGELVLVVDDEPSILALTKGCLELGGYHVLTANDGKQAVHISEQHRDKIAVVLTDMMMPDMDGPATIRAIREITPCQRFIGTSGGGDPRYEANALAAGASRFITKPYSAKKLLQTVREVLGGAI
jgi:CheY-like chemotaxis protein